MSKTYRIAVIPGDGIGVEVMPEAIRVLETVKKRFGIELEYQHIEWASCEHYAKHGKMMTVATRSNGIAISMRWWDKSAAGVAAQSRDVTWDKQHMDILCARFVLNPDRFDVVVATNLFGDILSDLGPACTGTIGLAPSGNINPERKYPSVFEPVHGSAPDIAGQGTANPIGQIWSGAMMLEHLGETEAGRAIV